MQNLTAETINGFLKEKQAQLVLFYADWCPFCRTFLKIVDEKKGELKHDLVSAKVNEDENPLWEMYKIETVPTLIAFSKGKVIARKDAVPHVGLNENDLLEADKVLGR
jgi:thioredoxin-like negative regulator of GroEL